MYPLNCGRMASAILVVGALWLAVCTVYERPRSSRSPVQQALISSEARISVTKSRKPLGLRLFCACGRTVEVWENGAIATFSRGGGRTKRVRRDVAPPRQALILRRAYNLIGYAKHPHRLVWVFFYAGGRMYPLNCGRMASAILVVGALWLAVCTVYERPRSSRSPVQQALISSEARISVTKSRKPLGLRLFCACGRTVEVWENGAIATFSRGGGRTKRVRRDVAPPRQALILRRAYNLIGYAKHPHRLVWVFSLYSISAYTNFQ